MTVRPSDLEKILIESPAAGLSAAAHRVRDAVLACADRAAGLAGLGALIDNRTLAPRLRAAALLGVVTAADLCGLPLPDAALAAVEDPLVIDAALQYRLASALTGALFGLPDGAAERRTRRLIGRRLIAAGERGPHVTRVLLDAGEFDSAVRAALDDYFDNVAPRLERPDAVTRVFAEVALEWAERAPDTMFTPFVRGLAMRDPAAPPRLAALLMTADAPAELRAKARHLLLGPRTFN